MELEEWEHVTCLKNVSLAYEGTRSGLKGYIAVGTNYNYGEDITSRGRVSCTEYLLCLLSDSSTILIISILSNMRSIWPVIDIIKLNLSMFV